jgi:hypothetical protein
MTRLKARLLYVQLVGLAIFSSAGQASAADIRGTISSTLTLTEDSQLVGDIACTMTGTPCITFGRSGLTLRLNGFAMTGQADAATGCSGGSTGGESGILISGQRGNIVQGPGVVRQFRGHGIQIIGGSSRVLVTLVTSSTNCLSGIFLAASSDNELEGNISVRNGNATAPCGGI